MALTHIRCPHCRKDVRVELHIKSSENIGRGPTPVDLGVEVETFIIDAIENQRMSFRVVGEHLMRRGVRTPRGGDMWYASSVHRAYRQALKRRKARS